MWVFLCGLDIGMIIHDSAPARRGVSLQAVFAALAAISGLRRDERRGESNGLEERDPKYTPTRQRIEGGARLKSQRS